MPRGTSKKLAWQSPSPKANAAYLANYARLDPGSQSDASKKSDLITVILGQVIRSDASSH